MTTAKELESLFNDKLFEAAKKAGMAHELARAQVEVCVREFKGKRTACITYEYELEEDENFVKPVEALARAKAFLAKLAPRYGVEV